MFGGCQCFDFFVGEGEIRWLPLSQRCDIAADQVQLGRDIARVIATGLFTRFVEFVPGRRGLVRADLFAAPTLMDSPRDRFDRSARHQSNDTCIARSTGAPSARGATLLSPLPPTPF
jgi:hypothetical protein